MQNWSTFYDMIGGAAATLVGLLFVAVSVNAEKILGDAHAHSRLLAEQAFQNYIAVLIVTLIAFLPGLQPVNFGYVLISTTTAWGIWVILRVIRSVSTPVTGLSRIAMFRRFLLSLAGFAMLLYAGCDMSFGHADDHADVAIGLLLLLVSATFVSWSLLVAMAGDRKFGIHD